MRLVLYTILVIWNRTLLNFHIILFILFHSIWVYGLYLGLGFIFPCLGIVITWEGLNYSRLVLTFGVRITSFHKAIYISTYSLCLQDWLCHLYLAVLNFLIPPGSYRIKIHQPDYECICLEFHTFDDMISYWIRSHISL